MWSTEYDRNSKERKHEVGFTKDDLQNYTVAFITHQIFSDRNSHKTRKLTDGSKRIVTVTDETMDKVEILRHYFCRDSGGARCALTVEGPFSTASVALTSVAPTMCLKFGGCRNKSLRRQFPCK